MVEMWADSGGWGEGMKRRRRRAGIAAEDLARRLGLVPETLRWIERGDLLPSDDLRRRWEDELLVLDRRGRPPSLARKAWRNRKEIALFVVAMMAAAAVAVCR